MSFIEKKLGSIIASFVTVCVFAAPAAESSRTYFNFDIGPNIMQPIHQEFRSAPVTGVERDVDTDVGFRVGVAEGFYLNHHLSVELEAGFLYNEFRDSDDWYGQVPILVNLVFKHDFECGLTPFIGAGAGGAYVMVQTRAETPFDDFDSDWVVAWQGMAGLRYRIEDVNLAVIYKYLGTQSPTLRLSSEFEVKDIHNHFVGFQVSYSF